MLYTCPMHSQVKEAKPGKCPICGMDLVDSTSKTSALANYFPLIAIVGLIFITAIAATLHSPLISNAALPTFISNFMIGFFLVFSGFKLLDLRGFAQGYATYDLLAQRLFVYGYVYPFIELGFGLLMIVTPSTQLLLAEIVVMVFSGLGVAIKLARHEKFQCACLGTFLHVPLTSVTLLEDFGMAFLALVLLIHRV